MRASSMAPQERLALERLDATTVRLAGRELTAFAGCDYLGLAHDPEVVAALRDAAARCGISAGASPSTSGTHPLHLELERAVARVVGTESALLVADGYLSNLVAAQSLRPEAEHALVDHQAHVSTRDALRATGFAIADYATPAAARAALRSAAGRSVLFTDGLFPSQGRAVELGALAELLDAGLVALVVDDSHALGVLGPGGRGSLAASGAAHAGLVVTGTFSKALGCFGGFVAGSAQRIERARERAVAYAGATPIPPALAAAALAALAVLEREPARVERLRANVERVATQLAPRFGPHRPAHNPVFALPCADPAAGRALHERLRSAGLFVPRVDYPDGLGTYLRVAVSSEHRPAQLERLVAALTEDRSGA